MILSIPTPCRVKGTLVGGSKSRLFTYWDSLEVSVPEVGLDEVVLAAQLTLSVGRDRLTRSYYGIKGDPGVFAACAAPLNRLGQEPARAFDLVKTGSEILPRRPRLRTVEADYALEDAADLQRRMDDCFVAGGILYVPTPEPYVHVHVEPPSKSRIGIEYLSHKNTDGNINSFALPDLEDGIALAIADGLEPEALSRFRRRCTVVVHDAGPFRYDPANGEIVYASRILLEMHETILTRMPIEDANRWLMLRDEVEKWAADESASPICVITQCQEALTAFARFNRISEESRKAIEEALQRASMRFVDEDLAEYSSGPGF